MGPGASTESPVPEFWGQFLTTDIHLNDPICKTFLIGKVLSHQLLDNPLFESICQQKPNNIRVLIYHMVFSISRLSQIPSENELPKGMLLSVLNSYLLFQRFHSFFIQSWDKWPTSSQLNGNLPEATILSSFKLLDHPQIQEASQRNSITYHIKYEMIRTLNFFLMSTPQSTFDSYPNIHFLIFDEADFMPLLKFLMSYQCNDELFRISVLLAANGLAFCPSWQDTLNSIHFSKISTIFNHLLQLPSEQQLLLANSTSPGSFHELIALFYQTLLNHNEIASSLYRAQDFLLALLFPLQLFNEKNSISYFHSLVLSSLVLFTSDARLSVSLNEPFNSPFPSQQPIHKGTYADILIEVITNSINEDFSKSAPLFPAIACIFHNISSHIYHFSSFSCGRIFKFLQQVSESSDRQASQITQIVIDGLNQILFEQFHHNTSILLYIIRNMKFIKSLNSKGIDVRYITRFIQLFRSKTTTGKMKSTEAEAIFEEIKPSLFMSDFQLLGPRGHIFTGEMAELWPEWIKTLAMRGGGFQQLQYHFEDSSC